MAGYVIHLAVAEQYFKKHPEDIDSYDEFIKGTIFPDNVSDKSITHYGPKSSKVNLKSFFENNELTNSYIKGYCLHLVTDYLFYNIFLDNFSKDIYNDYDILNRDLIEKFNLKIPEVVKNKIFYKKGNTKLLEKNSVIKFIKEISEYKLNDIRIEVLNNNEYWLTFKNLNRE